MLAERVDPRALMDRHGVGQRSVAIEDERGVLPPAERR